MEQLKNVLLVTNSVTEPEIALIKEALKAKSDLPIKLTLAHVIPNLPTCYFNIPSTAVLAERYYEEAEQCLTMTGEALTVSKEDQWLITGRLRTEVFRLAGKLNAKFILASSQTMSDLHQTMTRKDPAQSVRNINTISHF